VPADEDDQPVSELSESEFIKKLNLNNSKIRHSLLDITRIFSTGENHANNFVIDKNLKIIDFFEPHGYSEEHYFFLEKFRKIFSKYNYKVISPTLGCIRPPQSFGVETVLDEFFKIGGFCMYWNGFYLVYRMLYPDIPSAEISRRITKGTEIEKLTRFFKFLGIIEKIRPSRWTREKFSSSLLFLKSPVKTKSVKSPVKTKSVKSPVKTKSVKSPVKTKSVKSPVKTNSVKSLVKTKSVKSLVKTKSVKSLVKTKSVKSLVKTKSVKSPVK
jgi:hypothetical protein